jgi:hypothetical protein
MSGTTATLKGTVNLNGLAAGCANFIYYPQGNPGGAVTTANQSITGSGTISVSQAISGLSKGTVYLSRLNVADGACAGSGLSTTSGSLLPFLTPIDVPAGWSLLGIPSTEDTSMASAVFGDLNGAGALNGHATILAVYRNGRYLLYIPGYTQDFVLRFGEALAVLSTDSVAHSWAPGGSILTSGGTHTMPHGWNIVAPVRAAMTEQAICSQIGARAQVVVPLGGSSYVCGSGTGALIPNMQGVFVQMATDGSWTQP